MGSCVCSSGVMSSVAHGSVGLDECRDQMLSAKFAFVSRGKMGTVVVDGGYWERCCWLLLRLLLSCRWLPRLRGERDQRGGTGSENCGQGHLSQSSRRLLP